MAEAGHKRNLMPEQGIKAFSGCENGCKNGRSA